MSCKGLLPKLDHVIFADTKWEPEAVYSHLEWCKEFAAKHGISIDVRSAGNLRQDLLEFWHKRKSADGKRHASIPAYILNPDGSKGMVRRQCTGTYKIEVIERYVRADVLGLKYRQRWPLTPSVRQWIGISRDEMKRMKISQRPAVVFWHPLIEADEISRRRPGKMFPDGYSRQDCLAWIKAQGLPEPPRSACIGCPFRSNKEWKVLTQIEFADAVEVDKLIRENDRENRQQKGDLVGSPYLHAARVPLSEVNFGTAEEGEGFDAECGAVCGV